MADILEGETLVWQGRPVWKWSVTLILKWGLIGLLPLIAGILLSRWFDIPVAPFLAVTVVWIVAVVVLGWIQRLHLHYTVTDRRLVVRRGIVSRDERSASLDRIQNVNTGQGLIGRLLNFGDIEFDTAGSDLGDSDLALRGVDDPHRLRDILDQAVLRRDHPRAPGV